METPAAMPPSPTDHLQREVAELKKQLAAYQSANASSDNFTPTDEGSAAMKPFRFLDLPRELRDAIYKDCMVVDKVYIYHPTSVKTYDMRITKTAVPEYQLFRVNKQIHDEAKEVFTLKNLFVLTAGPCTALPALRRFLDCVDIKKVRRMSISFDYRAYAATGADQRCVRCIAASYPGTASGAEEAQRAILNDMPRCMAEDLWLPLLTELYCLRLTYLQLNLQNCYDPLGVERFVIEALNAPCMRLDMRGLAAAEFMNETNVRLALMEVRAKVVDIVGTVDEEERQWVRNDLAAIKDRLQFHGGLNTGTEVVSGIWDEKKAVDDVAAGKADGGDNYSESGEDASVDKEDESEVELDEDQLDAEINTPWHGRGDDLDTTWTTGA